MRSRTRFPRLEEHWKPRRGGLGREYPPVDGSHGPRQHVSRADLPAPEGGGKAFYEAATVLAAFGSRSTPTCVCISSSRSEPLPSAPTPRSRSRAPTWCPQRHLDLERCPSLAGWSAIDLPRLQVGLASRKLRASRNLKNAGFRVEKTTQTRGRLTEATASLAAWRAAARGAATRAGRGSTRHTGPTQAGVRR